MPDETKGFVYVNVKDLAPMIEGLSALGGSGIPPNVSANLEHVRSFLAYGSGSGDENRSTRSSRSAELPALRPSQPLASPVMADRSFLFTSESVTEGHPDKIADQVSDTILDAVLADDPRGRVACETLITTGLVVVAGEITTETYVDIPRLVRERIADIGYTRAKYGFDAETCGVIVALDEQSPDIAQGVDESYETQHEPGDRRPARPGRRGRPGDDVRLRDERDRRADAAPDHARAQDLPRGSRRCARPTCSRTCGRTARRR